MGIKDLIFFFLHVSICVIKNETNFQSPCLSCHVGTSVGSVSGAEECPFPATMACTNIPGYRWWEQSLPSGTIIRSNWAVVQSYFHLKQVPLFAGLALGRVLHRATFVRLLLGLNKLGLQETHLDLQTALGALRLSDFLSSAECIKLHW